MKGVWIVFLASFLNSEGRIKGCAANQGLLEFVLDPGPDPFEYSVLPVLAVGRRFLCSWCSVSVSFLIFDGTFVRRPESLYQGLITWRYFQLQVLPFFLFINVLSFFFFSLRLPLTCSLLLGLFAFTFSLSYFLQIHEKKDTNEKSSRDMLWAQVPVQLGKTFLLNGGYCFHSFLRLIPLDGPETSTGSAGHSTEWVWRHSLC